MIVYVKETKMLKTQIDAIVNYWAGFLEDPSTSKFDNGDNSQAGFMAMMLSEMGKADGYPEDEIAQFKIVMTAKLIAEEPRSIGIDYHTDQFLSAVADATLSKWSDMNTFPCKTSMYIVEDKVAVSEGYGAPTKIIWEKE